MHMKNNFKNSIFSVAEAQYGCWTEDSASGKDWESDPRGSLLRVRAYS